MATGSSLILCTLVSVFKSGCDISHVAEYQRFTGAFIIMIANRRWLLYEIATGILRRNWYKKNFRMILFL
jgi:hypothetical protein